MRNSFKMILIVLVLACSSNAIAQQIKAPDFKLKGARGKTYELRKYRGKVVIVNFWATWCGPCQKEIPDFIELYKKYKKQGVEIIGISLDEDGWESVTPFVKENGLNYPVVVGDSITVAKYGNFVGIPTTFIIDRKGTIVFGRSGPLTLDQLETKIKPLLKKGS